MYYKPYRPLGLRVANSIVRILDMIGGRILKLNEEKLIRKAWKKTGLRDFGDDLFREPLNILCELTRTGKPMTLAGRLIMCEALPRLLMNKLKIQAEIRAHPEILEKPVQKPIFILGLPRTGTTLLQRLMARDPGNRTLRNWEMAEPVPPPDPADCTADPRIKKDDRRWEFLYYASPVFKRIHKTGANLPGECIVAMSNNFISWWFTLITGASYLDWLRGRDFTQAYRFHKRQLQLLQWKSPGKRWVLKAPAHIYGLKELLKVFPDARIVQTHRDPVDILPSLASLMTNIRAVVYDEVDPAALGTEWFDICIKFFERGLKARTLQEKRKDTKSIFQDVYYNDLMADPIGTVGKLYRAFGIELSGSTAHRMSQYLKENPQHKHGKHQYTLEQFGLDARSIREGFAEYYENFALNSGHLSKI